MKLTEIRQILSDRNLQLTKSLGQNFLHDQNQIRRIVEAADLQSGGPVLEIGPGLGPLTEYMAESATEILAIEKDDRLVEFLREKFANEPKVKLIHDDALFYVKKHRDWAGWTLASNLPYSVASPILVELAEADAPPKRMAVTLQLEVAQRIASPTDGEHYGILSLLMQLRYEPQGLFKIPASCFFPEPDVDSACLTLVHRPVPLLPRELEKAFKQIVKCAFSQRRKMMMKLMKQQWPVERLAAAFDELHISPQIRAEKVSLEQFVQLTQILAKS
jgi:16S rRNA (adenine1518-N6/adenine1519-N6)-dimethyltransferase